MRIPRSMANLNTYRSKAVLTAWAVGSKRARKINKLRAERSSRQQYIERRCKEAEECIEAFSTYGWRNRKYLLKAHNND